MKKLLLVLSLIAISLTGCYVRGYDDGYRRDRDHHERGDHDEGRGDRGERGDHGDHH